MFWLSLALKDIKDIVLIKVIIFFDIINNISNKYF